MEEREVENNGAQARRVHAPCLRLFGADTSTDRYKDRERQELMYRTLQVSSFTRIKLLESPLESLTIPLLLRYTLTTRFPINPLRYTK